MHDLCQGGTMYTVNPYLNRTRELVQYQRPFNGGKNHESQRAGLNPVSTVAGLKQPKP